MLHTLKNSRHVPQLMEGEMKNEEITIEKIRQDFLTQLDILKNNGNPQHFAMRKARMAIVDQLVKSGIRHSEAVYLVHKAARGE